MKTILALSCYRLALGAAKRRDLSAAFRYGYFASLLDGEHSGAARLVDLCRYEMGVEGAQELEEARALVRRKKWAAAARALGKLPRKSVRVLNMQGCLWALAKRRRRAVSCFSRALEKDRGNRLALKALEGLRLRGGYFDSF
ncbi:MAG: hypothetical protein LBQ44_09345 [Treponema sp.]|jgi:hypothetical protein|nr:hypothetical protein [Treponema sp.]